MKVRHHKKEDGDVRHHIFGLKKALIELLLGSEPSQKASSSPPPQTLITPPYAMFQNKYLRTLPISFEV